MSDYTKTVDFAAKDSLPSGNSGKIIKGTEFETEFDNIATAIATKANLASPTFTGVLTVASFKGATGATVTTILDEDDMATDSATALATQQSIKAYVDAQQDTVDTLAEILALSNTTGGTNIVVSADDVISLDDGTNLLPSLTTTGDLNTGVYFPSADNVGITTGGTQRLNVSSTGIDVTGTATADALDVSTATGSASPTATELKISSSTNASDWSTTDNWGVLGFYCADTSGGGAGNRAQISTNMEAATGAYSSLDFTLANPSNAYAQDSWLKLQNSASSSERKVIVSTDGGLDVTGSITSQSATGYATATIKADTSNSGSGGTPELRFELGGTQKARFRVDTNDNVEIATGTGAGSTRLRITSGGEVRTASSLMVGRTIDRQAQAVGVTDATIVLAGNSNASGAGEEIGKVAFYNQDASGSGHNLAATIKAVTKTAIGANAELIFSTKQGSGEGAEALESMRLTPDGNVGIGSTSPLTSLWVQGASLPHATFANDDFAANTAGSTFDITMGATTGATYTSLRSLTAGRSSWGNLVLQQGGGNVGINVTDPIYSLEVQGEAGIELFDNTTSGKVLNFRPSLGDNSKYNMSISAYDHSGDGTTAADGLSINAFDGVSISTGSSTARQERMRVDESGNVKIGTNTDRFSYLTATTANLQIDGGVVFEPEAGNNVELFNYRSTDMLFGNGGVEQMRIDSSGNTHIGGTTSISTAVSGDNVAPRLIVEGTTATSIAILRQDTSIVSGNSLGSLGFYGTDTTSNTPIPLAAVQAIASGTHAAGDNPTDLRFMVTADGSESLAEAMRISGGNLLVGTTSIIGTTDTTGEGHDFRATGAVLHKRDGGTVQYLNRLTSDGDIVDFRKDGTAVGSISVTASATAYNTSSDQRLKENIADADDAGSKVDSIKVRKFDWIADGSHQDYGMIAQELIEVAPEAVSASEDPEDMMGVDYSKLVPMMLKEIQSLRARVAQLES